MFRDLKLLDTLAGMVIVNAHLYAAFRRAHHGAIILPICRQKCAKPPLVDGAGEFTTFRRIALPLARPALVASTLICFAFAWNEFLFASVLANRNWKPYPMLVAGSDTVRGIDFGFVTTRMLIAVTVPVILSAHGAALHRARLDLRRGQGLGAGLHKGIINQFYRCGGFDSPTSQ